MTTPNSSPATVPTEQTSTPKILLATFALANLANVVVVLCGLFALGSVFFAPPELTTQLLRASLFTALGASAVSIASHALVWFLEKRHPESPHAVQHWISAHAASIAGFIGANWMWMPP